MTSQVQAEGIKAFALGTRFRLDQRSLKSLEADLQLYNITFSYNSSGSMGARFQACLYLSGPELGNSCEAIPPLHLVSESGIGSRSLGV